MGERGRGLVRAFSCLLLLPLLVAGDCKDPPGPIGGLVIVIRSFEAPPDSRFSDVVRVVVEFNRIEVVHKSTAEGDSKILVVDEVERRIELFEDPRFPSDTVVGQFQVPAGFVTQARIHATHVTVHFKDGSSVDLAVENPTLPSWKQSGWKISAEDGTEFPMVGDQLTGMRGLMRFEDRFVMPQNPTGTGLKIKPTIDAELFDVNPPPEEPGVYLDQLVVVFKEGTLPPTIDAINAEIMASVIRSPVASNAYRVKLSPFYTIADAFDHYIAQEEVQGVLPMIVHEPAATPDAGQQAHRIANMRPAWDLVEGATGSVGSPAVRIAVIDSGVNLAHPELYLNIAINQGELPPGIFDEDGDGLVSQAERDAADTDGDGVISFRDLNSPDFPKALPVDSNGNGVIDGEDLLADEAWSDGIDSDDFDNNPNTFVDDLVGWDFRNNDNDPSPFFWERNDYKEHGTGVAQIAAAAGDNGVGIAGTSWHTSIVPMVAVSTDTFMDASVYIENNRIPIANHSVVRNVARKDADLDGARTGDIDKIGVSADDFADKLRAGRRAFQTLPWFDPDLLRPASNTLYIFGAGNSALNIGQEGVFASPGEWLHDVIPENVILAGWADSAESSSGDASYGSNVELWAPGNWTVVEFDAELSSQLPTKEVVGSSGSAPVAAGAAALLLSRVLSLAPGGLKERLIETAPPTLDVIIDGVAKETDRPQIDVCLNVAQSLLEELSCDDGL